MRNHLNPNLSGMEKYDTPDYVSITPEANRCGLLRIILVSSELLRRFSGGRSNKIIAMAVADVLDVQHKATREGLRVFDLQLRLKRMGLSVDVELRLTERVFGPAPGARMVTVELRGGDGQ